MEQLLAVLPQLAELIQKAGVVGVLLIALAVLVYEVRRARAHAQELRSQLQAVYGQRDRALLSLVKVKTICEAKGITVDLRDVHDLLPSPAPLQP